MRQDLFQSVGPDDCEAIMLLLNNQPLTKGDVNKSPMELEEEDWSKDLAKSRADDSPFMDKLCKTAIMSETSKIASKGTFFRGTSPATKLTAAYVRNSPAGKAYCQTVLNRYAELSKGKGDLEVKSKKDGGTISEKDAQKNIESNKAILSDMIDGMAESLDSVPPEIANICKTFTEAAQQVDPSDKNFVTTQSGGFLMLRVICPTLADDTAKPMEQITHEHRKRSAEEKQKWIRSGKDVKDFKPPEMSPPTGSKLKNFRKCNERRTCNRRFCRPCRTAPNSRSRTCSR